jgi:hypothetical protein
VAEPGSPITMAAAGTLKDAFENAILDAAKVGTANTAAKNAVRLKSSRH